VSITKQIREHNQSDTKSNPNPNPITKQHTIVNIQLNIVMCPTYPEKFMRHDVIALFLLLYALSLSHRQLIKPCMQPASIQPSINFTVLKGKVTVIWHCILCWRHDVNFRSTCGQ